MKLAGETRARFVEVGRQIEWRWECVTGCRDVLGDNRGCAQTVRARARRHAQRTGHLVALEQITRTVFESKE